MRALIPLCVCMIVACDEPTPSTPLPPDVDAVIALRCRHCHGRPRDNFAPMSIVSWEDTQAVTPDGDASGEKVYEAIGRRINDPQFPMPPFMQPALTSDERVLLNAWVNAGAPPAASDGGMR